MQGAGEVTRERFEAFLDAHLVPHFEGMTIVEGDGRFKQSDGTIGRERSFVVTLLYPRNVASESEAAIERAARAYVAMFHQMSVLVEQDASRVKFVTAP